MMFYLLRLKSYPIYEQLLLEEKLLRCNAANWCVINEGSTPAIVMGISGKKEELVDCSKAAQDLIPLVKRFSGGGTVVVDENTLFLTFVCQKQLHDFPAYPEPIMEWTQQIYATALQLPGFRLRENDFVIDDRKFGGNAQYIKKDRWLHHTSFLWDYAPEKMAYLLHPKKTPSYRDGRPHEEFLCRLSDYFPDREALIGRIVDEIGNRFPLKTVSLEEALSMCDGTTRQSTTLIEY
jgi:lipoate---protein ligase